MGDAAVVASACRRAAVALLLCLDFRTERLDLCPLWRAEWAFVAGLGPFAPRPRPPGTYYLGPLAPAFSGRRGGASLQRAPADVLCRRCPRAASGPDPGWARDVTAPRRSLSRVD